MDFDAFGSEFGEESFWGVRVRDHGSHVLQGTKVGDGSAAKLGVIEAENHFLRGTDHRALNFNEQRVRVRDSLQGDASSAHDGDIGVQFGERFSRERPNEHAQSVVEHTPGEDDLDAVRRRKMTGDGHGVRDDLGRFGFQMSCHVESRGAGVDDDGLMRRDELGADPGDGFFLRELMGVADGERELVGARIDDAGAAMSASVIATCFEKCEVAANG